MSSLADTFLEDLDELSGDSSDENNVREDKDETVVDSTESHDTKDLEAESKMPQKNTKSMSINSKLKSTTAPRLESIASLKRSPTYLKHMNNIQQSLQSPPISQNIQNSEEYQLVVTANDLMVQIDDEIATIHRFIAEIYTTKFPELDSLVPNALDYARVVQTIGNEMDMTAIDLSTVLPTSAIIGVSVTGSATSGKPLSPERLDLCLSACAECLALDEDRSIILQFVESRMTYIAPNVSQLVGTRTAAQLVGQAGGIAELARIPSCNVQVLGQQKKNLSGFSSQAALKHTGVIYYCDIIQNVPPYLRMKACRALAGKITLMARIDASIGSNEQEKQGHVGVRFRQELLEKIEKWQEPQKAKTKKALPIPDEKPRRKRGGKRYRKMKERLQMTDVRKEVNRQTFATASDEYGDNAMGITSGRLGAEGSGNLRILPKDQRQVTKKLRTANYAASMSKAPLSGLSSSLAFTPVQGMELMNPQAAQARVQEANKKYFGATSGFVSVVKKPSQS